MTSILDRIASLDQMFHTFQDRLSAMDDGIISLNQRVGHLTEKVDTLVGQGRGGAAQVWFFFSPLVRLNWFSLHRERGGDGGQGE